MSNEYDELAMAPTGDQQQPATANEYDAIVADAGRERKQRIRGALAGAETANPDAAAKAVGLSAKTGLPADMVERNLPKIEGEQKLNDYDAILQNAPKVGNWLLADPMNAKVAKDDYESLSLTEKLWNEVMRPIYGNRAGVQAASASVALRWNRELEEAEGKAARGEYLTPWDKGRLANAAEARRTATEATTSGIMGVIENQDKAAALPTRPAMKELNASTDWEGAFKAIAKDPLGLIFDLTAQSLPQLVVGTGAAIAGGPVAGVATVGLTSFGTEFVSGILDNIQDSGVDVSDPVALHAALASPEFMREVYRKSAIKAAVVGTVDAATMSIAGKTLAPVALATKPVRREAVNIVSQSLVQMAGGGGGEALGSVAAGQDIKPSAVLSEILGELGSAPGEVIGMRHAMKEGAALAGRAADVAATTQKATATLGALDALMEEAGKSGLAARSPEKFAEFMQSLQESDETVYVPAAKVSEYLQSLDQSVAAQMAERFEITDQLPEAMALGGDVLIPLAKYVTDGGEAHAKLREYVRTTPDGMSFAEARDTAAERTAQLEHDAMQWREHLADGDENATPGQQVYNDVFNQSRAAGYTVDAASQHAALYASRYQSRAERTGGDAWDAYQRSGLKVQQVLPESIRYAEPDQLDVLLNSIRSGKEPPLPKGEAPSLLEWLGRRGGALDVGGELKSRDLGRWHLNEKGKPIRGRSPLIADAGKEGQGAMFGLGSGPKRGLDDVALAAWESGYFPEHVERPSIDDFLSAVDEETRGRPRRSEDAPHDPRADFRKARSDLDETLNRLGLDTAKMRNKDIRDALGKVSEGEGGTEYQQSRSGKTKDELWTAYHDLLQKQISLPPERQAELAGKVKLARRVWELAPEPAREYNQVMVDLTPGGGSKTTTIGNTTIDYGVARDGKSAEVILIKTPRDQRGEGSARAAMVEFLRSTDAAGMTVFLTADPMDKGVTKGGLVDFYKSVGFKPNAGRNRDFTSQAGMVREPGSTFEQSARGSIRFQDGQAVISLFRSRDLSTFLHETGHLWLEEMQADAAAPNATEQVKADFAAILKEIGHNNGKIEVAHHERFARSFETYLMEGKAPSEGVRAAFASFKNWLVSIYRNLTSLDAPISDEMRAIFDRIVATDDEVASAREKQSLNPIFKDAKSAGMTDAEFAAYTAAANKALGQSVDDAVNKTMADLRKRQTKEWKAEAKAMREEVAREIMSTPAQSALHLLRSGKLWEGATPEALAGVKLDKANLIEIFGDEAALKMLPAGVYRDKGGADADTLAEAMGFQSGRAMGEALMALEQQRRDLRAQGDNRSVSRHLIETETERRMTERHGDALTDGSIEAEALAAVRNDRMGMVMSTELKALARQTGGTVPATWADIKAWAAETLAGKRVKEATQVGRYMKAEREAGKAVQRALLAGDTVAAFKAKQEQMVNSALTMEARRVADERDSAVKMLDRYAGSKTIKSMEQSYLDQIHNLIEKFDFKRATEKELNRRADFAEWAIQQQSEGVDIVTPDKLLKKMALTHYSDMTVEEMRGLSDTVKQIAHLGRMKKTLQVGAEQREFDAMADEAVSTVASLRQLTPAEARNPGVAGRGLPDAVKQWVVRFKAGARNLDSSLLKMEQVFDWLDRDNPKGVFNSVVFRPIAEAQHLEVRLQKETTQKLMKLNAALPKETVREWNTRHEIPELIDGKTGKASQMLKSEVVAMALNMGNASNKDKLLRGEKWSEDAVKVVLDRMMTKADWDYVQGVWDTINGLWPHVEAMEKAVNGVAPPKVESLAVETPHGTYRGGYYPVVYDPARSGEASDRAAKSGNLFENVYTRATTSRGFTNERVESYAKPIYLSLDVLPRHVSEVVHDIAFREPVRQADKFLGDKRIREAVEGALGPEVYSQFRPWLQNIANEWALDKRGLGFWENMARGARTRASLVGMGLRMTTMLAQGSGLSDTAEVIGPKWVAKGMASFVGDPLKMASTRDFIFEKSDEMRNRMGNTERDVRDALRGLTGKVGLVSEARRFAYYGIGMMDMLVALPSWMGAYQKGLSEGLSDADAVYSADKAVRSSQGAGAAKDMAAIQRGNEFQKLATMFYSYFNHLYNRQRDIGRSARDAKSVGDVSMVVARSFFLVVVPAIFGNLISGQGPKEDEDWGLWAARKVGANMFMGIPVLRDAVNYGERKLSGEFASYQPTPAARGVDVISKAAADAVKSLGLVEGEASDDWVKHSIESSGYIFGLPTGQIGSTSQFLWDVNTGRQAPDGVSDWFKGLVYGKYEDRKK